MTVQETKVCPKCGNLLFADMDVCYECLYGLRQDGTDDNGTNDRDKCAESVDDKSCANDDHLAEDTETVYGADDVLTGASDDACATEAVVARWVLHMSTDSVDVDIDVPEGGLIVGRSPACDVVLHAKSVSRQHVHIEPTAEGVNVCDLGARNTPRVNDRPIKGEVFMVEGDVLSLCGTTLELRASTS